MLAIGQGVLPLLGVDLLVSLALSFVGMLGTTLWVVHRRKGTVAWLPLRDPRWRQRLPGALAIVLVMLVASELLTRGVDAALALLLEEELAASLVTTSQLVTGFLDGLARTDPLTFAAVLLIVAVIGPIAEEVYFRGLLFGSLMERKGARYAIGMSALYFALLHLHPVAVPAIFAIGLLLAWLVDRTDSLALPITLHVLNNTTALLIARYA
uniref:CPBP family intramembrane metalloprotease n=1 Tax=Thermorudis sp. TaxID=1969470 RepID=A0A7C2WI99_9BACT